MFLGRHCSGQGKGIPRCALQIFKGLSMASQTLLQLTWELEHEMEMRTAHEGELGLGQCFLFLFISFFFFIWIDLQVVMRLASRSSKHHVSLMAPALPWVKLPNGQSLIVRISQDIFFPITRSPFQPVPSESFPPSFVVEASRLISIFAYHTVRLRGRPATTLRRSLRSPQCFS